MQLLYCDESNMEPKNGDFLLYGGVMIDSAKAGALSNAIDQIRTDFDVPRDFPVKFNPGPKHLDHAAFIKFKQAIIDAAIHCEAKFLVYVVLHNIAKNADEARRNGINTVCFHFHLILEHLDDLGLVLIDRFNDEGNAIEAHLREKFSVGLTNMPYAEEIRLHRILGLHYSAIGQSHFTSVIDILIGSLRHCINVHTRGIHAQSDSALAILKILAPLFWTRKDRIPEVGFMFSPKVIAAPPFRAMYQNLKDFLEAGGIVTEQLITGERTY